MVDVVPKFRVQLSGNPILGDGKSDNQNHAVIFHRGEYIQLIDANQDNYLEECLKIRSVLAEFEEMNVEHVNPYAPNLKSEDNNTKKDPVAFWVLENIFSQKILVFWVMLLLVKNKLLVHCLQELWHKLVNCIMVIQIFEMLHLC